MITVEIFNIDDNIMEISYFPAVPRVGDHIAILKDNYYKYFHVIKIWYRREDPSLNYVACVQVKFDD
jgi:hypothetical protein